MRQISLLFTMVACMSLSACERPVPAKTTQAGTALTAEQTAVLSNGGVEPDVVRDAVDGGKVVQL